MPKDHNGNDLKIGDVVAVPCIITGLDHHGEYIDVALETRWPMYPGPNSTPLALNTKQLLLVRASATKVESLPVIDVLETIKVEEGTGVLKRGRQ